MRLGCSPHLGSSRPCPGLPHSMSSGTQRKRITQKPGDPPTRSAIDDGEIASDEHVAIRLQGDRIDVAVGACAGIETFVEAAIGIEPGDPVSSRAVDRCETSPNEHLAILLDGERYNLAARSKLRLESHVQAAIGIEPGDA